MCKFGVERSNTCLLGNAFTFCTKNGLQSFQYFACVCFCVLADMISVYCKSGKFRVNFIFANSVKRHICDAKSDNGMIYIYQ